MKGNPVKMKGRKPVNLKRRPPSPEDPDTPLESAPPTLQNDENLDLIKKLIKKP